MVRQGYVIPNHPSPNSNGDTDIVIYGYVPSLALAVIGAISFGSCALAAVGLLYKYRWNWMTFLTLVGATFEVIGYIARSLSSQVDPYRLAFFVIQYFFIVVAPVFFAAAIYLAFGRLIQHVATDSEASPVRPRLVFILFLAFDVITTIVQIAGAASIGTLESSGKDPTPANNVLLAGLAIQTASFAVFICILAFCVIKFSRLPKTAASMFRTSRGLFALLAAVAVLVQIRTTFRLVETAQNVFGYLSVHEVFFGCLEFLPITVATVGLLWLAENIRNAMLMQSASSGSNVSLETQV